MSADRKKEAQRRWARRHRSRARRGLKVLKPVIPHHPFVEACLDSELLTEAEALNDDKVNEAVGAVLIEWMRKWRKA
jgi:hypothetical protein